MSLFLCLSGISMGQSLAKRGGSENIKRGYGHIGGIVYRRRVQPSCTLRDGLEGEVDLKLKDQKVPQTRKGLVKKMQSSIPFINYVTSGSRRNPEEIRVQYLDFVLCNI